MRSDVTPRVLDEQLPGELPAAAVADADPREVTPPVTCRRPAGHGGWNAELRAAFLRFHRSRCLAAESVEATYAISVGETVVGAARLCPVSGAGEAEPAVEAGVWIGRSRRGSGVGTAVLRQLLPLARAGGFSRLLVSTEPGNTAVHRLLAALGTGLTHEAGKTRGLVDLTARGQSAVPTRGPQPG